VTHAHDDPQRILDCVGAALDSDVVVITGGMSVGRHDHVADVLARLGVSSHFAGVAFRPGKPTSFGTHGATLVFGLPGNPVSSLMTFLLFARPALLTLAGEDPTRVRAVASLARDCAQTPARTLALRCRLELRDDGWWALDTGAQDSHILTSMLGADAIAIVPAGEGVLAAGTAVTVELLAGLGG
jgi:molybdopterin molybdotransferase